MDVYREMVDRHADGAVFVELGTFQGRSAAFMAETIKNSGKHIQFYTVDNHDFYRSMSPHELKQNGIIDKYSLSIEDVRRNLAPLADYVEIVQANSWEGIPGVETVDFCWVDASHEYEACYKDLVYWLPRAKIIGGDDFSFEGVNRAVNELAPQHSVRPSRYEKGQLLWLCDPNPYYD